MTKQTDQEQLMLELINRARLDPQAEADRYGIDLNDGLPAGTIDASPKQPLAMNDLLIDAARAHSQWMLDTDTFSHKGANESTATDRIQDAGYQLISPWKTGENINLHGVSPGPIDPTASIYEQHRGLFLSSGHRTNILDDEYREVGVGQKIGTFTDDQGQDWDSSMITQDYASSGSGHFITGVIYDDNDNNDFYSVGEGKSLGIQADTTSGTTNITSGSSGGYALHVDDNQAITLTFGSGGGAIIVRVDIGSENVKVDLVNNTMVLTSGDITLVQGITEAKALGVTDANITGSNSADTLTGSKGNNILSGGEGEDFLYGGAGNDTLYGGNALDFLYGEDGDDELHGGGDGDNLEGGAGNDTLYGEAGMDSLSGGDGDDTLYGGDNDDYLIGGAGNDALWGDVGQDTIHGDEGNDTIHGGDDYDIINGGEGNDTLYGDAGADIIHGGAGDDTIEGGDDNDRLIGGAGNDWLTGGAGADTFAYDGQLDQNGNPITPDFGNDEITDLDASADKIRLDMFVDDGGTIRPINRNDVDITDDGSGGSYITAKNPAYFSGQIHVRNSDPTTTETAMEFACFPAGTRMLTASGPKAIERLRAGDLLITASGKARPLAFLGVQTIHPHPVHGHAARNLPVRIAAHAFGPGAPARPLITSWWHGIMLQGGWIRRWFGEERIIVPAGRLINGGSIRPLPAAGVITLYNVVLEAHDVVFAEGLSVETFRPLNGNQRDFDNWREFAPFHLPDAELEARYPPCCPVLDSDAEGRFIGQNLHRLAGEQLTAALLWPLQAA